MPVSLIPPDLIERAHANLVETYRSMARAIPGGAIRERDGAVMISCASRDGAFNPTFLTTPPDDPDALIERCSAYYRQLGVPWTLKALPEAAAVVAPVAKVIRPRFGGTLIAPRLPRDPLVPGLLLAPIDGRPRTPPGLVVRLVSSIDDLRLFHDTLATAYPLSRSTMRPLDTEALLTTPGFSLYLGYVDHLPVATVMRATSHRIAGILNVSTLPAYRRRGIGEALTWQAALDGREDGCLGAALQASPVGLPLYERMGFRLITEYHGWRSFEESDLPITAALPQPDRQPTSG